MKKVLVLLMLMMTAVTSSYGQLVINKSLPIARAGTTAIDQAARDSVALSLTIVRGWVLDSLIHYHDRINLLKADIAILSGYLGLSNTNTAYEYDIMHDLYACIPVSQVADDYVMEININREYQPKSSAGVQYSCETSSLFKIASNNRVVINNPTGLATGTYNLALYAADSIFRDTCNMQIIVPASGDTYYVDITASGSTNAGTRENPFNTWTFTQTADKFYFFNRSKTMDITTKEDITQDGITFGAYGSGSRPKFRLAVGASYAIQATSKDNVTFRDLEWDMNNSGGGGGTAFFYANSGSLNLAFINLYVHGSPTEPMGAGVFNLIRLFNVNGLNYRDCEVAYSADDINYADGVQNAEFIGNYWHHANMGYNYATPPGATGGDCFQFGGLSNYNLHFDHTVFDRSNTPYKHALMLSADDTDGLTDLGIVIEHCRFIGVTNPNQGAYAQNMISLEHSGRGTIIRFCVFEGNYHRGILVFSGTLANDLEIYGNLFVGSLYASIDLGSNTATNCKIYNNTFYEFGLSTYTAGNRSCILIGGATSGIQLKNNIFKRQPSSTIPFVYLGGSTITEDYNLFYPAYTGLSSIGSHSKVGDPLFIQGWNNSYEISSNSPAYHSGVVLSGYTTLGDIMQQNYHATTPSMGCKEVFTYTSSN